MLLALDQSTRKIGWALGRRNMPVPLFGVQALPAPHEGLIGYIRDWLDATIKTYHVTKVCFETPYAGVNVQDFALTHRMIGVIELVCDDHDIVCMEVMPSQWRKHFIGYAQAPRTVPRPKRRAWLKREAIEACLTRRWDVTTDDEAEACGIFSYVMQLDA